MQLIKMNYKGFTFDVNPSTVKIEFAKNIASKAILFSFSKSKEMSVEPAVITGKGSFTGDNARRYAHELMRVFKSKGSAYLFAPDIDPVRAYFSNLCIAYNADRSCVDYSFAFTEDCQGKKSEFDFGYTYALEGENLYDIANRTDIRVEDIVRYNNYKDLFSVCEGDKVWLC